jgi:hypothetical protein
LRSSIERLRRFKFAHLALGFIARDSISFLHSAQQLIALAFNAIQIVVREFSPLLLNLAAELLPLAFDSVPVHRFVLTSSGSSAIQSADFRRRRPSEIRERGCQSASQKY